MAARMIASAAGLWKLFCELGDNKEEADAECEEMLRTLRILDERLHEELKRTKRRLFECQEALEHLIGDESDGCNEAYALRKNMQELEEHAETVKRALKKTSLGYSASYPEQIERLRKQYRSKNTSARRVVNRYLKFVEEMTFAADASACAQGERAGRDGKYHRMVFRGVTFYCDDTQTDMNRMDAVGMSNLKRMEQGLAPVGADGLPVNLHHMCQNEYEPIMEMQESVHKTHHYVLHINTGNIPSGINRKNFNIMKSAYWKRRAAFMKVNVK